jgi:hypothetical protein
MQYKCIHGNNYFLVGSDKLYKLDLSHVTNYLKANSKLDIITRSSVNPIEKAVSHFAKDKKKGETPIFRSVDISLDMPLPDKLRGNISILLEAFEYTHR